MQQKMSSPRIRVLSELTINQIAAGEVIENPASVVKELVENSLDAGAKSICIEILEGGRQLIRISDDGCGMLPDDALLSLERHATSKIKNVDDIQDLLTMGFRGEAIPSIAAISKFTLLTSTILSDHSNEKTAQANSSEASNHKGTLIQVEGGRILSCNTATRSPGTTIEVKSLFFNVPVRRKFQKSPSFDEQEILKIVGFLALANPSIGFELISNQKSLLKTPLISSSLSFQPLLGKRIECVLGKNYFSSLLPLEFQQVPYACIGFIGIPTSHRPNKTGQHLFLNQRAVTSPLIAGAIREGFGPMLASNRYPIFVLHITMPGSLIDVNVHPQKKEVRIRQEMQLKEMLIASVQSALRQQQFEAPSSFIESQECASIPPFWSTSNLFSSSNKPVFSPPVSNPFIEEPAKAAPEENSLFIQPFVIEEEWKTKTLPPTFVEESCVPYISEKSEQSKLIPSFYAPPLRVIATLQGYFLIDPFQLNKRLFLSGACKQEGGLALVNQRASYARIHYEKLLKKSAAKEMQSLLVPITLHLSLPEFQAVTACAPLMQEMGFELRSLGEQAVMIDAIPAFLRQDQINVFLALLIQDLVEIQSSRRLQAKKEEQIALAACRASLPSNRRLSLEESAALVQQLLLCEFPAQCPMGKPTCFYLSPEEIGKWFQTT